MTEHTPGPWHAFNADYQGRPEEAPIFVVGPEEFHTVAQVRAGNTDDGLPEQTPANAHLIAAAPDLLAALHDLHEAVKGGGYPHKAMVAASAAIAKATGG